MLICVKRGLSERENRECVFENGALKRIFCSRVEEQHEGEEDCIVKNIIIYALH
jgi:hypothetical protein